MKLFYGYFFVCLGLFVQDVCGLLYDRRECKVAQEGSEYMGTVAVTANGRTCQRWDAQSPHQHDYDVPEFFPDPDLDSLANYCRNPDPDTAPWCFTTDPDVRWEHCDVPTCNAYPECKIDEDGTGYRGSLSVTRTGQECIPWESSPFSGFLGLDEQDANSCRNPDGKTEGQWCYYGEGEEDWDFCDVPYCKPSAPCLTESTGINYVGKRSSTLSGRLCQWWDVQAPHSHTYIDDDMFADGSVDEARNYCRNPNGERDAPWCYTQDADMEWEYCDIQQCSDCTLSTEGREYIGTTSSTLSGFTCQRWDAQTPHTHTFTDTNQFPDASLDLASNYCRNPDGRDSGPWCFTTDAEQEWDYCDVQYCQDFDGGEFEDRQAKHVLHIGIGGLHATCWQDAPDGATNIQNRLLNSGSWTTRSRTVLKTISGPSWTASLCGINMETGGVTSDSWKPSWMGYGQSISPVTGNGYPFPCVFGHLKSINSNIRTAAFRNSNWVYWHTNHGTPGATDRESGCKGDGLTGRDCDEYIVSEAVEYLGDIKNATESSYTFVQIDELDRVGHASTWCNNEYFTAVTDVDGMVGDLLDAIDDDTDPHEWLVILSSDHGGSGNEHGREIDEDLMIPMFIRGPGIRKNYNMKYEVRNQDIVPTVVWSMGLERSGWWRSRVMWEAFEEKEVDY